MFFVWFCECFCLLLLNIYNPLSCEAMGWANHLVEGSGNIPQQRKGYVESANERGYKKIYDADILNRYLIFYYQDFDG